MSIKIRQIICLFFYLIFFIITPLIVAYAAGYKFDFNKKRLQKTGIFILDSKPQNAKIFINNQVQQKFNFFFNKPNYTTTPTKITNLLPGEYTVKLELIGYWPWEKKLKINSGNSTYAEDIFLFKQSAPILIKDTTKINDSLSNSEIPSIINDNIKYIIRINDSKILHANDFEIWVNDLINNKQTLITRISDNITGIVWHPSNNYIIYSTNNAINAIEMDDREKRNNTELIKFNKISSLSINQKGTSLYFSTKTNSQEEFYRLDIQ